MKIKIDIDEKHSDQVIIIQTPTWSKDLDDIISYIKKKNNRILGTKNEQTIVLQPEEIDFIYAENRRVYAAIGKERVVVQMKLYEAEQQLSAENFMRFSKSVVGNVDNIDRFELSFNGNLCVYFHSGNKEYITRTYVSTIKNRLTQGGNINDL